MTGRNCEQALAELEEFLHNELSKDGYADILDHLANCDSCEEEANVGIVLTKAVQRACNETAPEELRATVIARIREIQSTH